MDELNQKPKNKGGRPKSSELRSITIGVRLSEREYAKLIAIASRGAVATFLRNSALKAASRAVIIDPIAKQQWSSLSATTANLNQLTKAVNEGRIPEDLRSGIDQLRKQVAEVRLALLGKHGVQDGDR